MPLIPVGELRLNVNRWEGRRGSVPFLLVHGLASNARMWDGVASHLASHGHPVAAVDLRGHGRSEKPESGYDVATVAGDVAALIEALALDRPVVAGQSWGGNIVLELASRRPALVRGVAAVDGGTIELSTRFASFEECAEALAPPHLAGMPFEKIAAHVRAAHPDWPENGIEGSLANFEVREDGTIAPWLTFERHMAALRGLYEHRPSELLPRLTVPVLLIPAGPPSADRRASVEAARALAPRGRVVWVDGEHDIHAQHPATVAAALRDALADGFFR